MPIPDEIQLSVALLALVGSLAAACVALVNARERRRVDRDLVKLKAALDGHSTRELQETKERHELRLNQIEHKQSIERAELEKKIEEQLTAARVREALNEGNWQRVVEQIRTAKNVGHDLISLMGAVCERGHEISDEQVLSDILSIVKLHREFREAVKPLFGEIRTEDYDRLDDFHELQGKVILDIGRTRQERVAKKAQMLEHAQKLEEESRKLEALAAHFLRPRR